MLTKYAIYLKLAGILTAIIVLTATVNKIYDMMNHQQEIVRTQQNSAERNLEAMRRRAEFWQSKQ